MSGDRLARARDRIARLAGQGLDLVPFWQAANEILAGAVPHYMSPCWFTLDPTSLLVTSHYQPEMLELPEQWLAHEYYKDDVHKVVDVARSPRGYSTLHEVTGGEPSRSPGWRHYIQPYGGDQEALIALRNRVGQVWGMLGLYRAPGQPMFDATELRFLSAVAPSLARGAQQALLIGEAAEPDGPDPPGLLVLREDWSVESLTPGTARWLAELPGGAWETREVLPPSILAVAGRARRTSEHPDAPGEVALARVLSQSGRWMVLHAATLVADGARRVAVIIEPAHPARIAPLLMAAHGLTEREQDVTRLVLQGNSTAEIADQLLMSTATVQQHLKHIFEKTGVRSRRELVGHIFFTHYEPRLRDNERRTIAARPLRGGPMDRHAT